MKKAPFSRLYVVGILFSLLGALIMAQMTRIQTSASGKALRDQAAEDFEYSTKVIQPERGNIYDRWGNLLAGNEEVYEVGVNLYQVQTAGSAETIASTLSNFLEMDYNEVLDAVSQPYKSENSFLVLKDFVRPEQIAQLAQAEKDYAEKATNKKFRRDETVPSLTGLEWSPHLQRSYPEGKLASNVLGFVAFRDQLSGTAHLGIEEKYNDLLAGSSIKVKVPVDPNKIEDVPTVPPGASLILTIDREIQSMVEKVLDHAVEKNGATSGTIVVMNPKNGEILAMATSPRMDPNQYWDYKEDYFNRAIDLTYEPGSVFKVLTMAAALDKGTVTPDTPFLDTGVIHVGGLDIYNWDRGAWGPQTMIGCMQHSLNVCLAWVATQVGAADFYKYMEAFGLGHRTNIDLSGESVWPLSVPGDETWYDASLATNAFGQGIAATPIQMITAVSAIANDGQMMAPHVLYAVIDQGQQRTTSPLVIGNPITPETAHTLTEMLAVSLEEEASTALVQGYRVAGKTGTAEIPSPEGYVSSLTNASFVGWGPVENPQFVVYIWLEKPTSSPWGSIVAAPIFSDVVSNLVVLMNIPPDYIRQQIAQQG